MYDDLNPANSDDFDQWLRRSAPGVRTPENFRRNLKIVLLARFKDTPQPNYLAAITGIAAMLALILFGASHTGLVSQDFSLEPEGTSITGQTVFSPVGGDIMLTDESAAPRTALEQVYQLKEAEQRTLTSVTGWTVKGKTFFEVNYHYKTDQVDMMMSDVPKSLASELTPDHLKFLLAHEDEVMQGMKSGTALRQETLEFPVDGVPVEFTKWYFQIPGWGEIIYWGGAPPGLCISK